MHHHGLGALAIVAAIAWVFGERVARTAVGVVLITLAALFVWVMWLIVEGKI